jgi:hypothetical protein
VVHFDGEDLSGARGGWGVSWDENDFRARGDDSLFDTSSDDITYSLNLVDSRDRGAHRLVDDTRRNNDEFLEDFDEGGDVNLISSDSLDFDSVPPRHLLGFFDEVVTNPSRDWENWDGFLNEFLLPSNLDEHSAHFIANFFIARLTVFGNVAIHLVYSNDQLLDTEQVD